MFASGFMMNAWTTATIVAVVAGVVGYFVVLRGSAFPAHAIPKGAFAGAAGAALLGISTLIGSKDPASDDDAVRKVLTPAEPAIEWKRGVATVRRLVRRNRKPEGTEE